MIWRPSTRFSRAALPLADRHYNRQKPGTSQFVPPGACRVFVAGRPVSAVWVSSWPLAEYTKHEWAGAWMNTLFRKEGAGKASDMILQAVAATRSCWPVPPPLGMVSFVDPRHVKPVKRRGKTIYGYCYLMAGFEHVGETKEHGLWAWQLLPARMPEAEEPDTGMASLFATPAPQPPTKAGAG